LLDGASSLRKEFRTELTSNHGVGVGRLSNVESRPLIPADFVSKVKEMEHERVLDLVFDGRDLVFIGRIALAGFLLFLIGWEREALGSHAGDRTHALVAIATAASPVKSALQHWSCCVDQREDSRAIPAWPSLQTQTKR
jgi:hypothetical protein